jgi:hypothetical protein
MVRRGPAGQGTAGPGAEDLGGGGAPVYFAVWQSCLAQELLPGVRFSLPGVTISAWRDLCLGGFKTRKLPRLGLLHCEGAILVLKGWDVAFPLPVTSLHLSTTICHYPEVAFGYRDTESGIGKRKWMNGYD